MEDRNYDQSSIMVLENHVRTWNTTDSKTIQSIHPPTTSLAIEYPSSSSEKPITFEATAYMYRAVGVDKESNKIINK